MSTLLQDLKYGLRMLAKNPGFTAVAVLTLALGIGANTAIFSVVNAVLLQPLPYKQADRLLWISRLIRPLHAEVVAGADFLDWRDQSRTLESVAAFSPTDGYNFTGSATPERVRATQVSAEFFKTLGVGPALGRVFTPEEDRPGNNRQVILTNGFWKRHFASDPNILGQTVTLNGEVYSVVGVMPSDFRFPQNPEIDLLVPLALDSARERQRMMMSIVNVIGRLKPLATLGQARAELETISKRMEQQERASAPPSPDNHGEFEAPSPASQPLQAPGQKLAVRPYTNFPAGGPPARAPSPHDEPQFSERPAGSPSQAGPLRREDRRAAAVPDPNQDTVRTPVERSSPPNEADNPLIVVPLQQKLVGDIEKALLVLLAAVGLVLLIACANVANLILGRATARNKEMAVRSALGATRGRLVRLLLTESVLLALVGGAMGLLVANWGVNLLIALTPRTLAGNIFQMVQVQMDNWVLGFTLLSSGLTGILFGIAPGFVASRPDLNDALKEVGGTAATGFVRSRTRSLLVISELALALILLIGAGLLTSSFIRLVTLDPGFNSENLLTMTVSLTRSKYSSGSDQARFFQQLLVRLESLPGVKSVALADSLPLTQHHSMRLGVYAEGQPRARSEQLVAVTQCSVSPDYFRTMGIPLVQGRTFTANDTSDAPKVVVINRTLEQVFFDGQNALGRKIFMGEVADAESFTVIGVVADVKHQGLEQQTQPEMYLTYLQAPISIMQIALRTSTDPTTLVAAVRDEVGALDKEQPIYDVATMHERLSGSVASRRFNTVLLGLFAVLALLLASVGLYGVISYSVAQRTHEIGVRMALGAGRRDVLRMVVKEGLRLTLVGVGIGLAGAFALTRFLSSLLFGVKPTDPLTFLIVTLLLAGTALAASYIPARRATKVDPMVALRYE